MHARAGTAVFEGTVFEGTVPADLHLHVGVTQDSIITRSNGDFWYSVRHMALTMSSSLLYLNKS